MAVGRRAQATRILNTANDALEQKGLTEIRDRLDELLKEITTNADSLHNPDEVLDSTNAVAEELSKDKPNKLTIVGILKGIVDSTGSVARIVTAADSLSKAVMLFL
jgi:predicted PP-loop superfamily ATPase